MGFYIDEEGARNVKVYQYSGEDKSYIYQYVLTPMNTALIKLIPLWVAPNIITLIGFLAMFSGFAVTSWHSPDFATPLPPWVSVMAGLCMFAYQTLDNLDGYQARRTKSSSPLGLLFDHGIDALNVTVGACLAASIFQTGVTWRLMAVWIMGFVPFVSATWEEYYTQKLVLPTFNGPSDGFILGILMCFYSAVDPQFFGQTKISDVFTLARGTFLDDQPMGLCPIAAGCFGVVLTALINVFAVLRIQPQGGKRKSFGKLLPFAVLLGMHCAWAWYSPSRIFESHPRLFLFSLGFMFANLICKLMLAHLCAQEYRWQRTVLIPPILLTSVALIPKFFPAAADALSFLPVSETYLLYADFAWSFGCWLHFAANVIHELTTILSIHCFSITHKKTE